MFLFYSIYYTVFLGVDYGRWIQISLHSGVYLDLILESKFLVMKRDDYFKQHEGGLTGI